MVSKWNAIYFSCLWIQILHASLFISIYLTDFSWNYNPKQSLPTRHLNFSTHVTESMTSPLKPLIPLISFFF
jgi:hypothetical protein